MFRLLQKRLPRLFITHGACPSLTSTNRASICLQPRLRTLASLQRLPRIARHPNPLHLTTNNTQQRWFWGVYVAFNKIDADRVRLAGPDRAAAEWVLRNGGSIKWTDSADYLKDYNFLPSTNFQSYKIEEIDLTAADVIDVGFEHLENLKYLKSIKLHGCGLIQDYGLENLHFVKDTLERLEISRCPMITDKGLQNLCVLEKLKTLVIYDLIELKNFDDSISRLRQAIPWCHIDCEDPLLTNPETDANKK